MAKSNNETFWQAFTHSGSVEDYLTYKSHLSGGEQSNISTDDSFANKNALTTNILEDTHFGKLGDTGAGIDNQGTEGQRK